LPDKELRALPVLPFGLPAGKFRNK